MGSRAGWRRIIAAIAGGLIIAGAFPPLKAGPLIWVGMLPILWALWSLEGKRTGRRGFALGYLAGLASGLVQCHWVSSVAWLGAVALPAYLAIYWGIFGIFAAKWANPTRATRRPGILTSAFCHGAVWAGLELARGWIITGFSWNVFGVALAETPWLAQGADLLGVSGLSLLIVFFQATALQAVTTRKWHTLAVASAIVGLTAIYGIFRIHHENNLESIRLQTLLVQLNVPMEASRMLMTDVEMHQAYEEETLAGLAAAPTPPHWVMWPEMSLTGRILTTPEGDRAMWQINHDTIEQVRSSGSDFQLIYGVGEVDAERNGDEISPKENGRAYNSVAIAAPSGAMRLYRKHHLVIFGETIPFVDSIPFLKSIYEQQAGVEFGGSFTPGESLDPLPVPVGNTTVGAIPTICFEDSVPRLTRRFVRPGPQVIINVTNDGWFKESAAADQHFQYARFRAIELRRPMLRSANSGVSAAISTTGSVIHPQTGRPQILADASGSHFTRGSLLTESLVPLHPSFSLYALCGDWTLMTVTALALWLSRARHPVSPPHPE